MNKYLEDLLLSKATTPEQKTYILELIEQIKKVDIELKLISNNTTDINSYEMMIDKFDLYPEAVEKIFERNSIEEVKRIMTTMLHFIGLSGEVGELGEKIKKSIRDDFKLDVRNSAIAKEMGDCEWYLTRLESDFGYSKNEILSINYDKLSARLEQKKLHGSGDDREK
jgi:NTP pyrophosphatase (non-canonical NTP hydrolase)